MWKQSIWTSTISSHLATKHLKEGGLLTLAGAKAALDGTPGEPPFPCLWNGDANTCLLGLLDTSVRWGQLKPFTLSGALQFDGFCFLLGPNFFRGKTPDLFICIVLMFAVVKDRCNLAAPHLVYLSVMHPGSEWCCSSYQLGNSHIVFTCPKDTVSCRARDAEVDSSP